MAVNVLGVIRVFHQVHMFVMGGTDNRYTFKQIQWQSGLCPQVLQNAKYGCNLNLWCI